MKKLTDDQMKRLIDDPEYVQGQIESLRSLVLALANLLLQREQFRDEALERLEMLRTALIPLQVSETRLLAVEDCEKWVRSVTQEKNA